MKKRIHGLETEFAIKHYPSFSDANPRRVLSETEIFEILSSVLDRRDYHRLFEKKYTADERGQAFDGGSDTIPSIYFSVNKYRMFLGNGARFYMDTGSHPEYATPECLTARDIVVYDKAGERIIEDLLVHSEQEMAAAGYGGEIFICKNNVDIMGNTYGCHENYLVERSRLSMDESGFFKVLVRKLMPFLVTRQIFCGSGKIYSGDKVVYQISQRADYIDAEISSTTTSIRGIINSRDEALSSKDRYRRLHLIVGDANMSEICTFLKVGTTSLILRLIEQGRLDLDLTVEKPVQAIKEISHDPTLRRKIRLKNGFGLTALEVQMEYLQVVRSHFERNPEEMDTETQLVLEWWGRVLKGLKDDPLSQKKRVDWITKKWILDRYLNREDCSFEELERWGPVIRMIKNLRLEERLLFQNQAREDLSVREFLMENMRQVDFIELNRYARFSEIDFEQFFRFHKIYHGLFERDLRYHDIRRDRGIYYLLVKNGYVEESVLMQEMEPAIVKAMTEPPQDTRARIRGEFIKAIHRNNLEGGVKWDAVYLYGDQLRKIEISNPFHSTNKKVTEILREV